MSDQPDLPEPGDLFASRYRIASLLGKGGFGAVYQARDTSLERDVALKVLLRTTDEQSLARFLREARASAALASEHVATVYEVGSTGDGPYIVMELLRGCDLQDELDDRKRLPVAEAVDHVLQAALGIAHAHARGIVHRDLKPRNLFVARRDDGTSVLKVLDFGIAKSTATDLTQTGTTLGTPRYMAPEQLRSARTVDARTDVWALGVVLYELVSGKPIFDDETATQLAVSIVIDPHVKLRARDPELPEALEASIDRCLEKEPDARFADVHRLALALAPFATDAGKALIPRIERALGDRASGVIAKSAAMSGAATMEATPGTDDTIASGSVAKPGTEQTLAMPSGDTRHQASDHRREPAATKPLPDDAEAGNDRRNHTTKDGEANDRRRQAATTRDGERNDRRTRAASTQDGDSQAAATRDGEGNDRRAPKQPEVVDDRARFADEPARGNRVTIIALLIAGVAIAIAVVMWQRGPSKTSNDAAHVATTDAPSGTTATTDAAVASTSVTTDAGVANTTSAADAGRASTTATTDGGLASPASATDAGIAIDPADASRATDAGATRPARDAGNRPVSDAEIAAIETWCQNRARTAPLFIVPNNDGPMPYQCGRFALLGCAGIKRGCQTRPTTDAERQQCRDFADVLRKAEICQ